MSWHHAFVQTSKVQSSDWTLIIIFVNTDSSLHLYWNLNIVTAKYNWLPPLLAVEFICQSSLTQHMEKSYSWARISQYFANNFSFSLHKILETEGKLNVQNSGEATFELE